VLVAGQEACLAVGEVLASGLEIGFVLFTVDEELVGTYGNDD
jgi:hypothetical protein